jgi:glycine cleavage system H protein
MQPHEIITLYTTKPLEYIVAILYLALFVGFWRFVNGEASPSFERARALTGQLAGFFRVPAHLFFHPGHAWARPEGDGVLTIGVDDFAQQLVGPIESISLPQIGTAVNAGAPAWSITADAKTVDMLAPVTGAIVAVNDSLAATPGLVNEDPYGNGWVARVRVTPAAQPARSLMWGRAARAWMERVTSELTAAFTPELGQLSQDGGVPMDGFARGIDSEHWDEVARRFLLS